MCNRYATRKTVDEVGSLFRVPARNVATMNVQAEVYPGYPGMVIRDRDGADALQAMTWGFPLSLRSKKTGQPLKPKPVNNAREDKLQTAFWRDSFRHRRCLIPLTAWAEAEGPAGAMTCTWYSPAGADLFAVAGVWRPTAEWGDAYSMVMVDGCQQMADVHDRMPVILPPDRYDHWLRGPADDAAQLVRTFDGALSVLRAADLWFKPRNAGAG